MEVNMKKIIPIAVFLILIISGIGTGSYLDKYESKSDTLFRSDFILLTEPMIKEKEEYLLIELEESNSLLQSNGEPILPIIIKKYVFPFGTKINNIQATFSDIKEYNLPKKIAPAPSPVTRINDKEISAAINKENAAVYTGNTLYPSEQYSYSYHAGLEKGEHVVILNIQCCPIQYQPVDNKIYSAGKLEIDIEYEQPENPVVFTDEYDLVVIAPEIFSSDLQPLIDHKNSHGVETIFKTTESITNEYTGRDQPEKIKYFIKDAVENWDISYVLLVGGKKSLWTGNWGIEGPRDLNDELWHCPVRYNTLEDSYEQGVLTDLYFADIYKYDGEDIVFEDWDSDGNGWFGEWTLDRKDTVDMYPDVNVGRLVCRNKKEVQIMVDKIITYEAEGTDPSWFNKIVGIGGDSFDDRPPNGGDYFEGEERNKLAAEYLGFDLVKIWTSQKDTGEPVPTRAEITRAINDGCGFLYFAGHGATALFRTYWYHDWSHGNATEPFDIYDMMLLRNGEKLPICVVGACHNSEFNVSFFNYINSRYDYYPTPECWSWVLTRKIGGGSIATIGYTGLEWVATYGWDDDDIPDCTQYFSGYIDSRFFHAYGVDGVENLGACWSQAITEYLDKFPGRSKWDTKTTAQWFLMGDPSLKIGGYT
jgi:hypothetical protein